MTQDLDQPRFAVPCLTCALSASESPVRFADAMYRCAPRPSCCKRCLVSSGRAHDSECEGDEFDAQSYESDHAEDDFQSTRSPTTTSLRSLRDRAPSFVPAAPALFRATDGRLWQWLRGPRYFDELPRERWHQGPWEPCSGAPRALKNVSTGCSVIFS